MAAKGGVWTKKGFVKAADRKDAGGNSDSNNPKFTPEFYDGNMEPVVKEINSLYQEGDRIYREELANMSREESDLMDDSIGLLSSMRTDARWKESAVVIKGQNGKTEAVAVLDFGESSVYLEYLVTNPKNILKNSPDAVRGAGTQAIAEVARLTLEDGRSQIRLTALDSAKPFYKKLGFQESDDDSDFILKGKALRDLAEKAM